MELNRVLIVDDDPAIRRVVSALLDLDEYGLLEAADGQAALEVVRVERPDLVILDLTMPRLDGLGACAALRSDPELAGTRVLVLTGRDQPDDRAAARDAGGRRLPGQAVLVPGPARGRQAAHGRLSGGPGREPPGAARAR
jgi:CheY-like chemotaxis protein